jgi:predicted phage-related endonuclease
MLQKETEDYKYLCHSGDSGWLTMRHTFLTASAVPTWLGQTAKWATKEDLIIEKRAPELPTFRDTVNMWWGRNCEADNRRMFSLITGLPSVPEHGMFQSKRWPHISATLDALCLSDGVQEPDLAGTKDPSWVDKLRSSVLSTGTFGLLEMKQTECWYGKEWAAGAPINYWTQLQAQLYVTGLPWGILACRIGAAGMIAYFYERDESFAGTLEEVHNEFIHEVVCKR